MSNILVVGSVAYDTISTPKAKVNRTVGGSANYFSLASSLYSQVNVVGVVGDDYATEDLERLQKRSVDLTGLQKVSGKTFHWEGKYENDMNEAMTIQTDLNVFENFDPILPESYLNSEYVFLANIDPVLQMAVLNQVKEPQLVGMDTMNFWIDTKMPELKSILSKVDVLLLNEGEARALAKTWNTITAAKDLAAMGPEVVVIKRGEYGFLLYNKEQFFVMPAFPVENVVDPTGAGDTFAGGFFGYLSKVDEPRKIENLKQACVHGCLLASFTVEDFGVKAIENVDWSRVEQRQGQYRQLVAYT